MSRTNKGRICTCSASVADPHNSRRSYLICNSDCNASLLVDDCDFSGNCSFQYFIPENHFHDQDIARRGINPSVKSIIMDLSNQNNLIREYGSRRIISEIRQRHVGITNLTRLSPILTNLKSLKANKSATC